MELGGIAFDDELDYCEFMKGMCNATGDRDVCGKCGGNGLAAVGCCSGFECGCRGMPVDFIPCDCGSEPPTNEQIKEWASR